MRILTFLALAGRIGCGDGADPLPVPGERVPATGLCADMRDAMIPDLDNPPADDATEEERKAWLDATAPMFPVWTVLARHSPNEDDILLIADAFAVGCAEHRALLDPYRAAAECWAGTADDEPCHHDGTVWWIRMHMMRWGWPEVSSMPETCARIARTDAEEHLGAIAQGATEADITAITTRQLADNRLMRCLSTHGGENLEGSP